MQQPIGTIIDSDSSGQSDAGATRSVDSNGNQIIDGIPTIDSDGLAAGYGEHSSSVPLAESAGSTADNRTGVTSGVSPQFRRKPGRPPGSKNRINTESAPPSHNLNFDLAELLLSLHMMAAQFLKVSELELDTGEAKRLSESIQKVGRYYAVVFDPKKLAIFDLCAVATTIYGTRAIAYMKRREKELIAAPPNAKPTLVTPQQTPQQKKDPSQPSSIPSGITNPSQIWDEGI